jgi:hypothetical protein
MNTHDDGLEPTPQDYGFPANPSLRNLQCWDHQEAFLRAYSELGTILHAAKAVGVHRVTVNTWQTADLYSFRKRMELAHQDYVENVERLMNDRLNNPQGNRGSDILLMFKLKAERPEKYREEVKVLNTDAPLRMLEMLKELGKKELEAIEGEYRELPAPATEPPGPGAGPGPDTDPGLPHTPPERTPEPPLGGPPEPKGQSVWGPDEPSGPPPREVHRR